MQDKRKKCRQTQYFQYFTDIAKYEAMTMNHEAMTIEPRGNDYFAKKIKNEY